MRFARAKDVFAAVTDRRTPVQSLLSALPVPVIAVEAEQVHGTGIAAVSPSQPPAERVPGCDALVTQSWDVALLIRTADCLPVLFSDPEHEAIAIAHAGWRGLESRLPMRVLDWMRRLYGTQSDDVEVILGPAMRPCCYAVGPEFIDKFSTFIRKKGETFVCDLPAIAKAQLTAAGVRPDRIHDVGACTGCGTDTWFSLRREGPETTRLFSLIVRLSKPSQG